jgi:hypothetical protein
MFGAELERWPTGGRPSHSAQGMAAPPFTA